MPLGRFSKPDDTIKVSVNMDDYYQIRDAEEAEKNLHKTKIVYRDEKLSC